MKKQIATEKAPSAIGPYSQAIRADKFIYVSGQIPVDPATGAFPSDKIEDQTKQSLENIKAILECEGYSMADVVKTTVLMANLDHFGAMNDVYATYFPSDAPARAAFQVSRLPKGALIEIEAVAYKD